MLGRYNLTPANRKGGKTEIFEYQGAFFGTMSALMGAGVNIELERFMESQLTASAGLRFGYDARMSASAAAEADVNMRFNVQKKAAYSAEMAALAQPMLAAPFAAAGEMEAHAALQGDIVPVRSLYGDLQALWNSVQIKETVMRFEKIEIPPEGTVVIDSEFFTATMDGENIVDLYEGDWLEFTHRLLALEARGVSSGELDVTVLYREMYL